MTRPRLLDCFCGAGGATRGYQLAGFHVTGVDIKPQPNYVGEEFIQADVLEFLGALLRGDVIGARGCVLADFGAIHASPPCHAYSSLNRINGREYPKLIEQVRDLLVGSGLPYVIENVPFAPLREAVMLCGSSFRLGVRRHRQFECNFPVLVPGCAHGMEDGSFPVGLGSPSRIASDRSKVAYVYGSTRYPGDGADRKRAMGIDWMTNAELTQAIPPAYCEHIGGYLLAEVNHRARVAT